MLVSSLQVEPWTCPPALSLWCRFESRCAASAAALSQRLQKYLFLQRLGAIKLSFLFLYLPWPRHRGNPELREEGLAVLCCWEAFGQPLFWLWELRDSSGLGESCSETTKGSGRTVKLIISWQK